MFKKKDVDKMTGIGGLSDKPGVSFEKMKTKTGEAYKKMKRQFGM